MVGAVKHDAATDIWSVGAVMYTFFFGHFPYNPKIANSAGIKDAIRVGQPAIIFYPASLDKAGLPLVLDVAIPMFQQLLCRDSLLRPSAKEVLQNRWFTRSSLDMDQHDFGPCFERSKRLGVFDVRNMANDKKKTLGLTELEQRLTDMQQENFPRTAKFCTQPFAKVLMQREYKELLEASEAYASGCSTYTGDDVSPASSSSVGQSPSVP